MNEPWTRNVPVFNAPIRTRLLYFLCFLGVCASVLALFREIAGLEPVGGMNDEYAWGIWKSFNVMAVTGLGSGSFSVGLAIWLFRRNRLHVVMRTAALSSFLIYASGLVLLGVDVARPWNFYWIALPWKWNAHSPMLEIAFCMPVYTAIPLFLENLPPLLESLQDRCPELRAIASFAERILMRFYPWILGLAFLLPAMHQSSLGALMLLAGNRVDPLWQTPFLPLLYVWAAAFMGTAFVIVLLLAGLLVWKRPVDIDVLAELSRITMYLIASWLVIRTIDLGLRGRLGLPFHDGIPGLLFLLEMAMLIGAAVLLGRSAKRHNPRGIFQGSILASVGGLLYRYDPTTWTFNPEQSAFYFPSAAEILIAAGFVSLAIAAFAVLCKALPILPASTRIWYAAEAAQWRRETYKYAGKKYKLAAAD